MTAQTLSVLLGGSLIGHVTRDGRGRLAFGYEPSWRQAKHAIPLSLSMPLAASVHPHEAIEAFMWGLLPDNEQVLERWAKRFQVSARNAFALLSQVGEDCAGAVQFAVPENFAALTKGAADEVTWLREHEIAERLRALRADHASGRMARDTGQFSLAGAQAKTALLFRDNRWGVPSGRTPTTHILKPPISGLDGHVENEHLCLTLARELGLPTATSFVHVFEDEPAIVIERYDRLATDELAAAAAAQAATEAAKVEEPSAVALAASAAARAASLSALAKEQPLLRLHQEDCCQALGVMPSRKYQNEGGPRPQDLVTLLRTHSSRGNEDVATFVDALIFNWLIAGTDAHAKNYSLLLAARGQVRLAPLYDLGSALPYRDMDRRRIKLAMKLGDTYRIRDVAFRQFEQLARELALDSVATVRRAEELAEHLLACISLVCEREMDRGLTHPIVNQLRDELIVHAQRCAKALRRPAT